MSAKERQAAEAKKNADILLRELELERSLEQNRKAAAARKRDKRRQKKKEKQGNLDVPRRWDINPLGVKLFSAKLL